MQEQIFAHLHSFASGERTPHMLALTHGKPAHTALSLNRNTPASFKRLWFGDGSRGIGFGERTVNVGISRDFALEEAATMLLSLEEEKNGKY